MDCREAQSLINQFIDDRMDDDTAKAFIEHVRKCPSCYDDLEVNYTVMTVIRLLEDGDETLNLPKQLDRKIEEKELKIQQHHRSWMMRRTVGVLICVAGIFILTAALMFGVGRVVPKKHLVISGKSRIMNVMDIRRPPEAVRDFLYIKSGNKIRLVTPDGMPGIEIFDIKRTSMDWGKLVVKYE